MSVQAAVIAAMKTWEVIPYVLWPDEHVFAVVKAAGEGQGSYDMSFSDEEAAQAECDRRNAEAAIRAALEAMREPSEEMCEVGYDSQGDYWWKPDDCREAWKSMLEQWAKEQGVGR